MDNTNTRTRHVLAMAALHLEKLGQQRQKQEDTPFQIRTVLDMAVDGQPLHGGLTPPARIRVRETAVAAIAAIHYEGMGNFDRDVDAGTTP